MPGGVNSNFRLGISPTPLVIERGEGAWLHDIDGNRIIDYYLGMGPMILGHNPPEVVEAVRRQLDKGLLFAAQTEIEYEAARLVNHSCLARSVCASTAPAPRPCRLPFALRARPPGDRTILKCEGHYHGWFDNVVWSVAPSAADMGPADAPTHVPASPGLDPHAGAAIDIIVWNDLERLRTRLAKGDVAGIIMEPIMCNQNVILPDEGYLEGVRKLCDETGTILIFDEVITGFRVAPGGAQALLGVTPDLAVFGKAIANGLPVAAVAGKAELMDMTVTKRVMHGGTYNAHPLGMAATVATLSALASGAVHKAIAVQGRRLMEGFESVLRSRQIAARVQGLPQIFHVTLGVREPIHGYRDQVMADKAGYVRLTTALLGHGVRALERGAWFLSSAHDEAVVDTTIAAFDQAVAEVFA